MVDTKNGNMLWMNIGRRGGEFGDVDRGIVKAKVATLLQASISPRLAVTTSSDQSASMNLDGRIVWMHRSMSSVGAFPDRAMNMASRIACRGLSCHGSLAP